MPKEFVTFYHRFQSEIEAELRELATTATD